MKAKPGFFWTVTLGVSTLRLRKELTDDVLYSLNEMPEVSSATRTSNWHASIYLKDDRSIDFVQIEAAIEAIILNN